VRNPPRGRLLGLELLRISGRAHARPFPEGDKTPETDAALESRFHALYGERCGPLTRAEALAQLQRAFAQGGLETPALDARLLVLAALGIAPIDLVARPDEAITSEQETTLADYADRRLAREPVARILGEWEFWGLPFVLSAETLVPRPETEILVKTALARLPDAAAPLRILDLGTGTGCLLIAMLTERPLAIGLGVDRSPGALATARANARRNGVHARALFAASDWARAVRGPFDLIVANPPYIASGVIPSLEPDVRDHDPALALDGGKDGLDAYRIILSEAPRLLAETGVLVLEIGFDQAEALQALSALSPLDFLGTASDLTGNARCVTLKRLGSFGGRKG
jgi:release factor glutamine methyltransferase